MIEPAFTGYCDISVFQFFFQFNRIQNQINSGSKAGVQITEQCKSQSAGGTGPCGIRIITSKVFGSNVGILSHGLIQIFLDIISHAFLRTIDISGSIFAAQRIRYITGNLEMTLIQKGIFVLRKDAFDFFKGLSAFSGVMTVFVQKFKAKSFQHSDTAIICSTSTDSDDEVSASFIDGVIYHFPHTVSGCMKGIFFICECNSGC